MGIEGVHLGVAKCRRITFLIGNIIKNELIGGGNPPVSSNFAKLIGC